MLSIDYELNKYILPLEKFQYLIFEMIDWGIKLGISVIPISLYIKCLTEN